MPPSLQAPIDWAASSTTGRLTLGRAAGRPNRCTGITARVLAPQAAAAAAGSRLKLSGSTSANTGRAPRRAMQPTVAKKESGVVTTSSPWPTPSAINATSRASVPDDTPMARPTPSAVASSFSNASTSGPRMKPPLSITRVTASCKAPRNGAFCALTSSRGTFIVGWPWPRAAGIFARPRPSRDSAGRMPCTREPGRFRRKGAPRSGTSSPPGVLAPR